MRRLLGGEVSDKGTVRSELAENAWMFCGGELWGVGLACAQEVQAKQAEAQRFDMRGALVCWPLGCGDGQYGAVGKSRQLRSRHFPVLTYSAYAPRVKMTVAFPSRSLRTGLVEPFGKTQGMLF
ncbi:hypothetical protein ACTRXD_14980 [Nitrospira sp. T9]|uniref:hypothetical protein n=1 Tax=unclassified Nitrospira TaxID=2652172 RepID=UPI003F977A55